MARRPTFLISEDKPYFKEVNMQFTYFNGFSIQQKQKSVESLHAAIKKLYPESKVLEISRYSLTELGTKLSAFNLAVSIDGKKTTVESAFQSSKVFENGGPYTDLFYSPSIVSKKDQRLSSSGRLMKFVLLGNEFPTRPKTFFYDWLYVNAVSQNTELLTKLSEYNAFTDIAFNPEKSINCQARSAAICVSLFKKGLLSDALKNKDEFKKIVYSDENKITEGVQISFF
jgi:type I restriction enzyme M protein